MASPHDLVAIRASMGGLDALRRLVAGLPADLPAAVLVVMHLAPSSPGALPDLLAEAGPLPVAFARDGEEALPGRVYVAPPGRVYVAPPGRHLLATPAGLRLSAGARENRARPAIDPLFRSAAVAYRSRVVGVVLTGLLDDGAAGLLAVARCGGLALVQDPADAPYPDMPRHALAAVPGARRAPVRALGALIGRLAREPAPIPPPVPHALLVETRLTENDVDSMDAMDRLGERVPLSCPDCGGALWEISGEPRPRYRCHVGHALSEAALLDGQAEATERALFVALRTLEERHRMLLRMARDYEPGGRAGGYAERAAEVEGHAEHLRALLASTHPAPAPEG